EVVWQSKRTALYQAALDQLNKDQMTYRCICSRKHIEETLRANGAELGRHEDLIYPGSCRNQNRQEEKATIRVALPDSCVLQFKDRMKGVQSQDLTTQVGDFVLRRLQQILGYQIPSYLHLPLVTNAAGEKLSKQTQALEIDTSNTDAILNSLRRAAIHLGLNDDRKELGKTIHEWLLMKANQWRDCYLK
ncbi:MAG: tRNA glutamyl-Q(34) synthetase GluQRS, partial [Burkholderiaceae bacterium]|nr:tRNA glutamyl-Q(34) synthetase GluQRS [Burkholderiaceae bacterium]